ncbi:MAG TPA: CARDB domain-containing protein, partial [Gemmataceae bacterium]|nr:CARDB domain-containing protein [Gemmataceae bacterium]
METLEDRTLLSIVSWIGGSGDWNDTTHWSTGSLPGATDDVQINVSGITVTHSAGAGTGHTVQSLTTSTFAPTFVLSGGTLTVAGSVQIGNAFTLSGGTLTSATVSTGTTLQGLSGTLTGVTVNGPFDMTGAGASVNVTNGLTLNGTLSLGSASGSAYGLLNFQGGQSLSGTGSIVFGGNSSNTVSANSGTLSIGPGFTLHGANGTVSGTFANQGTIQADVAGGAISLSNGTNWSNGGTIQTTPGGGLVLLGGSFTTAGLFAGTGAAVTAGAGAGTIRLAGTLTNTGSTLTLDANTTGSWDWQTGSIIGGTLATANGAALIVTNGGTLNGVTLAGTLDMTQLAGSSVNVTNGLTLNTTLNIGNSSGTTYSQLNFLGTQTLGGSGSIVFGGNGNNVVSINGGNTLTIGNGILVHGTNGAISGTFANQGTIQADVAGGTIALVNGTNWTNTGMLQAVNGATLQLGGHFATAGLGSISTHGASGVFGTVNLTGTLTNTGNALLLNAATGSWNMVSGSQIIGGALNTANGAELIGRAGTLNGVTINGTLDMSLDVNSSLAVLNGLTLNSTLDLGDSLGIGHASLVFFGGNQTLSGTGTIVFGGDTNGGNALTMLGSGTLTVGPGITIRGKDGTLSGTFANQGTIQADVAGGTIALVNGTNWTNTGVIQALNSGTVQLGGSFTTAGLGSVRNNGGTIRLVGTLTNSGSTLLLNASSGSWTMSGTIIGGALHTADGAALIVQSGTLNGMTVNGTLDMASLGGYLTIVNGLTLNSLLNLGNSSGTTYSSITFQGSQTLGGNGAVVFGGNSNMNNTLVVSGGILTVGPSVTIHGIDGTINGTFVNQGTIQADGAGGLISLVNGNNWTNTGTLQALNGGTLSAQGTSSNFSAAGTLTGGTWRVFANSTMRVLSPGIVTNAASVLLDGSNSNFYRDNSNTDALSNFSTNSATGSFTIQNHRRVAIAGPFSNNGVITIGPGSTFSVTGSVSQSSAGVLGVQIGGSSSTGLFGRLVTPAAVSFGGTLAIGQVNGFGTTAGDSFPIMSFGSSTGVFAAITGLTSGRIQVFAAVFSATSLVLNALVNAADLAVNTITVPSAGIAGQNATISYTVTNLQATPTSTASWVDSVYLSTSMALDPSALLIGRVQHTGTVGPQSSYAQTLTAPLPGVVPGSYYVIVVSDSRGLTADINRANNTLASAASIQVDVQPLSLGITTTGTIDNSQDIYYRVDLAAASSVLLTAHFAAAGGGELYVRYANIPDRTSFDQSAVVSTNSQQQLQLSDVQAGTYYILLYGRETSAGGKPFDVTARAVPLSIQSVGPNHGGNMGQVTVTVLGSSFSPSTRASLVLASGSELPAMTVLYRDATTVFATLNLTNVPLGTYDLRVRDNTQVATLAGAFNVTGGVPGYVTATITSTAEVRQGRTGKVVVDYFNAGDTDAQPQSLQITSVDDLGRHAFNKYVYAANTKGPGGILPPGYHGTIALDFIPPPLPAGIVQSATTFTLLVPPPPSTLLNWNSTLAAARPSFISPDAWTAISANFISSLTTVGQFETTLANDATYLSQFGVLTTDPRQSHQKGVGIVGVGVDRVKGCAKDASGERNPNPEVTDARHQSLGTI